MAKNCLLEMASNMIYIVALGVGLKCSRKIHLNTQCPPDAVRLGLKTRQTILYRYLNVYDVEVYFHNWIFG